MAFDIRDLQKGRGPVQARSKADEGRAVLKYIDVDDLVPSEDNFYSMSAIEELATLIELSGGVKQPALVVPLGGGKYKVIAGHRRRLASIHLVKQGKDAYRKMPCMVDADEREPGEDADELRAIDEAILLITTNGQREKTDWDKVQEATRLRALLEKKRRFEKIPGETRKLIAEQLGTTPAQVGRYDSIEKHLIPEFKACLEQGVIGISVAYDLSTLPGAVQRNAAEEYAKKKRTLTLEDVRKWKEAAEGAAPSSPPPASSTGITMVTEDETGPAPTPEQMQEFVGRAKERGTGSEVVLPAKLEDEAGVPPVNWTAPPAVENAGKVVSFHTPTSQLPEKSKQEAEEEWAVLMLGSLRNYCEIMADVKVKQKVPWTEYAEALDVALSILKQKKG